MTRDQAVAHLRLGYESALGDRLLVPALMVEEALAALETGGSFTDDDLAFVLVQVYGRNPLAGAQ